EVAHAEAVAPVEVGGGSRNVRLVPDPTAQVHGEDGDEDRDGDQQEREQAADDDQECPPEVAPARRRRGHDRRGVRNVFAGRGSGGGGRVIWGTPPRGK